MTTNNNEVIDLSRIFFLIKKHLYAVLGIISLTVLMGVSSSYLATNLFTSSAKLTPIDSYDVTSGIGSSLGLGNILGDNVAPEINTSLEILSTRDFFERLLNNQLISDTLNTYNSYFPIFRIFSQANNISLSFESAYSLFSSKIMSINFNDKKKVLTISVTHPDPNLAKDILDIIVDEYNSYSKERESLRASRSVEALRSEIAKTQSSELRLMLSNFLIQDLRRLQLSEFSDDYLFQVIDSPRVPEKKSSPNRVLFLFISFFVGIFLSLIFLSTRRDY